MNILFASSEIFPFAKSGGLADVAGSLPKAMSEENSVEVIMPLYKFIDRAGYNIKHVMSYELKIGFVIYPVSIHSCIYEGITCWFLYSPILCDRDYLYGSGGSYSDNDVRFGIFCYGVLKWIDLTKKKLDILHLNDWQTALMAWISKQYEFNFKILLTIHNLAFQGIFSKLSMKRLGIDWRYFKMEGLEFYDKINILKAGIVYSDALTTVSPTYAEEILTPAFGCGLDGVLIANKRKLKGILNGIDTHIFSPKTDRLIAHQYDKNRLSLKQKNKRYFCEKIGFSDKMGLIIFIGRLTRQKGVDLILEAADKLSRLHINIAILGSGSIKQNELFEKMSERHKNISVTVGYDEVQARIMYAAADFLLMPSLFEPCGLNQMIAMRYGTVPIVRKTGGLKDSVHDFSLNLPGGQGICFDKPSSSELYEAVSRAISLKCDNRRFKIIKKHNMKSDFSWEKSAKEYIAIYKELLEDRDENKSGE